jgi:hypothetical protein
VHQGILVSSEADVAHLPGLFGRQDRVHRASFGKHAIRVFQADDFVVLHQVDAVGLEPLQALVNLLRRRPPRAPLDLGTVDEQQV